MTVRITPRRSPFPAFILPGRGSIKRVKAVIHAPADLRDQAKSQLEVDLAAYFDARSETKVEARPSSEAGQYHLLSMAETEDPWAILGFEQVFPAQKGFPEGIADDRAQVLRHLSRLCVRGLQRELEHGKTVDEHMEKILTTHQALADGYSSVTNVGNRSTAQFGDPGEEYAYHTATLHQQASLRIAEQVAGVTFASKGDSVGCHGLGVGVNASMATPGQGSGQG